MAKRKWKESEAELERVWHAARIVFSRVSFSAL